MTIRTASYRVLSGLSRPIVASRIPRGAVRVLTYHDAVDDVRLRSHLEWIAANFSPIDLAELPSTLHRVPDGAVVITFDDGDPSIVERALPILQDLGLPATCFVCPGLIDTNEPYWWEVVEAAIDDRVVVDGLPLGPREFRRLKMVPDRERRHRVKRLRAAVEEGRDRPVKRRQLSTQELKVWIDSGRTVGNHTWDHPLLDMCDEDSQLHQIDAAHEWLLEDFGETRMFSYPNGNFASRADERLRELGYSVGAMFDHRLYRHGDSLRMSRIRVNASDDLAEFKAKVSGLHPLIHKLMGRS